MVVVVVFSCVLLSPKKAPVSGSLVSGLRGGFRGKLVVNQNTPAMKGGLAGLFNSFFCFPVNQARGLLWHDDHNRSSPNFERKFTFTYDL